MPLASALTRRRLLGLLGGAGVATVAGVGIGQAAEPYAGDQNGDLPPHRSRSDGTSAVARLGTLTTLTLGSIDFQFIDSVTYEYVVPGGVQVTSGGANINAGLRLPAGTRIKSVTVFLNPNGSSRTVDLTRYRPLNLTYEKLGGTSSTAGTGVEAVSFTVNHDVRPGWNYRIDNILMSAGGAILYGAKVTYRPPI